MAMDEATWRRHASPWSVWTRVPILPALALAIFSRAWIGWWALLPVALLVVWTFLNPRVFAPPRGPPGWATRAVWGERLWLARHERPVPRHHAEAARRLTLASGLGLPILAYGLIALDGWATVAGTILAAGAKLWFVDRMVWLYDEAGEGRFTLDL
ncbi:hypothetical protein JCR33_17955 [Acuticoccus sp. 2012]|uniref:Uncharacterized protein n=2 Tax=Acuticoccus mangrovi TaxID=2796142 RepID=A0A934MI56_9HYPH|nr:DUF6653 family protein [Acuticoccus mangrovi]MBJ3777595.1 hypothetical protein [Acuticoccus mangrovi]